MTFTEYLNQKDEDKRRRRGVKIKEVECEGVWRNVVAGTKVVSIDIHGEFFTYVTKPHENLLWTVDEDGNPKNPSCFTLDRKWKKQQ